jgi:tetratricopeptide (TPR) repeat protein
MRSCFTPDKLLGMLCLLMLTLCPPAPGQLSLTAQATLDGLGSSSAEVKTSHIAKEADETYFLLRTLEWLYGQLSLIMDTDEQFAEGIAHLRSAAAHYETLAARPSVEPEVVGLFENYQEHLKTLSQGIHGFNAANQKPLGETLSSVVPSSLKGYAHGKTSLVALTTLGVPPDLASYGAAGIGILSAGASVFSSGQEAYAKRDQEHEQIFAQMEEHRERVVTKARLTARSIATRRGWNPVEIGWHPDLPPALVQALVDGDMPTVEREVERIARQRPRDPYIQTALLGLKIASASADYRSHLELAIDQTRIMLLVPSDAAYHDSGFPAIFNACILAIGADDFARRESKGTAFNSEAAKLALVLCDKALEIKPTDPTGVLQLLRALALIGCDRPSEALKTLERIKRSIENASIELQSSFFYATATALSQVGRYNEALNSLAASVSHGLIDIKLTSQDPLFAPLRDHRQEDFMKVFEVHWRWSINDDWLFDDVTIENTSAFPLTNVKLTLTLVNGSDTRNVELELAQINPGQSHLWTDAVTGTSGPWSEKSRALLTCDQKP